MIRQLLILFLAISIKASTLHLSISSNPSKLNPLIATDSASGEIADWVFDSLIKYDKDANIAPSLAKSYEFEDNTTLIFHLREGVKWSDGVPFSADDVIFTFNLITSPKIFTPYASEFRYVKSVEKIDDLTIKVTYKEPYFKALHTWMISIVPKHILKDEKDIMTSSFNQHPIGTGRYTIKGFEISKDIKLDANPNYFLHKPNIDKIIYHFIPDPATGFLMLKSYKLDVGSLTPLQVERQIDKDFKKHFNIFEKISQGYTYMGFNLKNKKFKNPKVRLALSLALDRKEMVDILFFGHGRVCRGPFMPKTFAFNDDIKAPKPDLKRAKELLKEAGYDEKHPLSFELVTNSNNKTRVYAAQIIQHQLKRVGVKVKIRTMEWQAFLNTVVNPRRFETVLLGWGLGLMPDAYSIWHSDSDKKGGFNFIHYKNERVDKLIKKAEKITDLKRVGEIYREIFALIVKDNPYLFLYIPNSITAVNRDIKNVSPSIIGVMHNVIDWIKP
jgi:peptide/nickel transport system substrate-binding protein